jgi:Arc/MetJ-type ribon-helix-helix transcriptional regulator
MISAEVTHMVRTGTLKQIGVKVDEQMLAALERVRDPELYPTQSDFVREAIRRMVREERRNRVRAEAQRAMQDPAEVELQRELANANIEDWFERLELADRGEF